MTIVEKLIVVIRHYLSAVAAALVLVVQQNGSIDRDTLIKALIAGVTGPVIGAVNPNETAYGIGSAPVE
jgi:hypothetical protein